MAPRSCERRAGLVGRGASLQRPIVVRGQWRDAVSAYLEQVDDEHKYQRKREDGYVGDVEAYED